LQNDRQVQKISKHITKKVADKLEELYKTEKERYENCWEDIATFVKFGCMREEGFYEKVEDIIIFKDFNNAYKNLTEIVGDNVGNTEENSDENSENAKVIYYASDRVQQAQYIQMFKDAGVEGIYADTMIDTHFVQYLEYKFPKKWRFVRVDADLDSALKGAETSEDEQKALVDLFKEKLINKSIQVRVEQFKSGKIPAIINVDEFMRRMGEMQAMQGFGDAESVEKLMMQSATLVLNLTNPVISSLMKQSTEKQELIVNQIYYLAMLSFKKLSPEELTDFVEQSTKLLYDFTK
jgi:molecular chaperone HtpG